MRIVKRIICTLLLVSMLASMFFAVSAAESNSKKEERTGITIERIKTRGITHPEGYYLADKKLEEIPVTYEAWVYMPSSKTYPQEGNVILANTPHIYAMGTDNWFSFELKNGCEPKLMFGYDNKKVTEVVFWEKGRVPKDTWTHLVLAHDISANKVSCYINGDLKETKSFPVKFKIDKTTIDNLLFLAGDGYSANKRAFTGTLGDVAVYSDVRSAAEVKSDYKNGANVNDEDLLLYYQLSADMDGKDAPDLSGNGYNMNYYRMMLTEAQMDKIRKQDENEYAYSIAFIPDTQYMVSKFPERFEPIYDYILENKDKKNIKYVVGLGDMTDANSTREWNMVKEQIDRLNGVIPYSIIRGNHDGRGTDTKFDSIFAQKTSDYYKHVAANGGFYQQNSVKNTYLLFEENGVKYMILNLDYGVSEDVLKWADKVISEHPEHRVMIVTHAWLNINAEPYTMTDWASPSSEVPGSINPDQIWKKHFKKHANIDMIICGHTNSDQVLVTPVIGDNGNTVYQILMDGQYADISTFNGLGLVGLMYFTADGRFAKVEYYSTVYNRYYYEGHTDIHLDLDAVASDSIDISGKVSLEGKELAAGDFTFLLISTDGEFYVTPGATPIKVKNAADGTFVFEDVTFYKSGTYHFILASDAENSLKNVTLDESVYHVTVKVNKNSKGELTVSETLITKKGSTEAVDTVAFANVYDGSVVQNIPWIWIAAGALAVVVAAAVVVLVLVSKKKRAKNA